nr:uncharacterized protein LOC110130393 isoform X2 [Odocoileus virginianus texanus]
MGCVLGARPPLGVLVSCTQLSGPRPQQPASPQAQMKKDGSARAGSRGCRAPDRRKMQSRQPNQPGVPSPPTTPRPLPHPAFCVSCRGVVAPPLPSSRLHEEITAPQPNAVLNPKHPKSKGWRPMQNYGHTLDSGCSKPWGTEQQELVRSLGAPGGDEHRCRLAAPRSQGLMMSRGLGTDPSTPAAAAF